MFDFLKRNQNAEDSVESLERLEPGQGVDSVQLEVADQVPAAVEPLVQESVTLPGKPAFSDRIKGMLGASRDTADAVEVDGAGSTAGRGFNFKQMVERQMALVSVLPSVNWLIFAVLAAGLLVGGFATYKLNSVVSGARTVVSQKPVTYKLEKTALSEAEYKAIIDWYARLHPSVEFSAVKTDGGAQMVVIIDSGLKHAHWIYALGSLQSRDQDVVWESSDFCVGRCPAGAARAVVKGYRQKIVQQ